MIEEGAENADPRRIIVHSIIANNLSGFGPNTI